VQPSASSTPAPRERPYEYDDPTRDTDKDGIADPEDRCPTEPGKPNPGDYNHGCPTTIELDGQQGLKGRPSPDVGTSPTGNR
jgi:hypothetical protein